MKEKFKNSILQKTITSILVIMVLINLIFPVTVKAKEDLGGILYEPIQALVLLLGDAAMGIINICSGVDAYPIMTLNQSQGFLGSFDYLRHNDDAGLFSKIITKVFIVPKYPTAVDLVNYVINLDEFPDELEIPIFLVSPETIFANDVALVDANILNPEEGSTAYSLQTTISKWYNAFRNLAIVGLLSVLVYIGIRIIISSTATDKSKYKQMFMDWLIAFCLLFFMHYIMSFSITMVESLTDALKNSNDEYLRLPISFDQLVEGYGYEEYSELQGLRDSEGYIKTNLMGYVRFMAQTNELKDADGNDITVTGGKSRLAYTIIYCVLVIYTIMFLIIYIKRFVYICFLTIISPLVALTYPIDKMKDGKAQAFNTWLREYIFNLLIQPIHLLLYMTFVGSALSLAGEYLIYPLVVLGFMLEAEKIVRKLFGFENASTASSLTNSAFGGALVMKGMDMLKGGSKKAVKGAAGTAGSAIGGYEVPDFLQRGKNEGKNINSEIPEVFDKENKNKDKNESNKTSEELALEKYNNEGYGTNSEGHYFNPWTEEYDENYDPTKDKNYIDDNLKQQEAEALRFAAEEENQKSMKEIADEEKREALKQAEMQEKLKENEKEKNPKKPNYFKSAATLTGRYIKENPGKIAKGALKGLGMGVGAATLGTVGIAAGLASDDFGDVFKYGAAGIAAGAGVGGSLGKATIELPSSAYKKTKELHDKIREEAYGKEEYKKIKNKELDDAFMRNKEMQKLYQDKFRDKVNGEDEWKVAMKAALKYREYGITDNDTIIKAMKAKSKFIKDGDFADKKRIVMAQLSKQAKTEKEIETVQERLRKNNTKEEQIRDAGNMLRQINELAQFD